MRIGVVAPSTPITREAAEEVTALARQEFRDLEILFHPQCFLSHNHFAGSDDVRAEALVEIANDPGFDAVWFARGGYGSCRVVEQVIDQLGSAAGDKTYLGYSDAGYVLGGLYSRRIGTVAHGPMPNDIKRDGGADAVRRALAWLQDRSSSSIEATLSDEPKAAAFNITVFSQLLGTPLQPDLADHVLMLEDVSEYMYRTDRSMFHITSNPAVRNVRGIRLGRCSEVPINDPDFGESEEEVFRYWCARSGIAFLGRADIGHDVDNKIVPFG